MNIRLPRAASPNDPMVLTGRTWNGLAELVESLARLTAAPPLMLNDGPAGRTLSLVPQIDKPLLRVRNVSGADAAKYTPMGVDGVDTDPDASLPSANSPGWPGAIRAVRVNTLAYPEHVSKWVVLAEDVKDGKTGLAWAHGVCPVLALVEYGGTDHGWLDVDPAGGRLRSQVEMGSARVLWTDLLPGVVGQYGWCLVRLGDVGQRFWVRLNGEDPSNPGRYAWRKITFGAGTPLVDDPSLLVGGGGAPGVGGFTAYEASGTSGLGAVRVELELFGADGDGNPIYVFAAQNAIGFETYGGGWGGYTGGNPNLCALGSGGGVFNAYVQWPYDSPERPLNGFDPRTGDVLAYGVIQEGGRARPVLYNPPCTVLIPVKLTTDGGSDGDKTTQASYTYSARTVRGNWPCGSALTPLKPRPNGKATPATQGVGYWTDGDSGLVFVLCEAYETPGTAACST